MSESQFIKIHNSSFEGNQDLNGGAINFQNINNSILFSQTNFSNNTANASGGALYFLDIGSTQINFDSQTKIFGNKVLIGGRLIILASIIYNLLIPLDFPFADNVQFNSAEIYGNHCTAYLQFIEIQSIQNTTQQNSFQLNFYQNMTSAPNSYQDSFSQYAQINNFQSGNMINLRIYILDNCNRYLNFSLEKLTNGSYPEIFISVRCPLNNPCINCPQSALQFYGSTILLRNGYWRLDNSTDQIQQSNLQIDACQAEDTQTKSYCSRGQRGPLCQQYDILGEIWEGTNYCESFMQGTCLLQTFYLGCLSYLQSMASNLLFLVYTFYVCEAIQICTYLLKYLQYDQNKQYPFQIFKTVNLQIKSQQV
ncbi:hypothetical protein ABPG72_006614 [Tetrahymena utriculariae]